MLRSSEIIHIIILNSAASDFCSYWHLPGYPDETDNISLQDVDLPD
jgi:peroxiredoxin